MPFLRGEVKVREIGQMTVLEKDIVSDSHLPIFPDFRSWRRQRAATAMRDSSETDSGLRRELVRAEESSTDGASMVV